MGESSPEAQPLTTIDDVTPEWLSTALSTEICSFTHSKIGTGQMSNTFRLTLTYATPSPSNPDTLILKLASLSPTVRKAALSYGFYEREVRFYRDLAPELNLGSASKCYFAAFDPLDGRFSLLLKDAGLDAQVGDDLVGASKEQAFAAVREIARFHGEVLRMSKRGVFKEMHWLKRIQMSGAVLGLMFGGFYQRFFGKEGIEQEDWELMRKYVLAFDDWQDKRTGARWEEGQAMGLNHCDFRMDNILFGEDGKLTIVDWQTLQAGPVVSDLAYFVGSSLKTEDRREWMEELVGVYVDGIGEGTSVDRSVVMEGLRQRCWVGVLGAIVGAMVSQRSERGDEMLLEMMRRSCGLVKDLDAAATLPKGGTRWGNWLVFIMSVLGRGLELTGRWG
jgi:hypothetical protein